MKISIIEINYNCHSSEPLLYLYLDIISIKFSKQKLNQKRIVGMTQHT